jgi:hypothetical protein
VRPLHWIVLSAICVAVDYAAGPTIQFPLVYLAPVSIAAWYGGRAWGLALACLLPLIRLALRAVWEPPWSLLESSINAAIRIVVFASFAWLIDRTARQMRELRHMRLLEGMLGVCGVCKKIRDDRRGEWQPLDQYVAQHPGEFNADVCPDCAAHARDLFDRR